ncbi:MAG: D-sedoheptulose 7-phosphate isomerase [Candidatus Firestonebacteria bacterium]|nr:D-sedoheptulose 7-phosphate isomerase [Candidatus Firestonebacteria bacterium]
MDAMVQIARQELLDGVVLRERAAQELAAPLAQAAEVIARSLQAGGKLLICGNGGSAADAQHYATELVARLYQRERPAMAAVALTTDTSALTALANDYGFERVFSRQVEALGRPGDVLLGLSTSGNSANVLAAMAEAKKRGMRVVVFVGQGGQMASLADVALSVPSANTMRVQEIHLALGHVLCKLVEEMVYPSKESQA